MSGKLPFTRRSFVVAGLLSSIAGPRIAFAENTTRSSIQTAISLKDQTIPDGQTYLATSGYYRPDGRGAARYRLLEANEPRQPGEQSSNGGSKRWGLAEDVGSPSMMGAAGDGQTDDTQAVQYAHGFFSEIQIEAWAVYLVRGVKLQSNRKIRGLGGTLKAADGSFFILGLVTGDEQRQNVTIDGVKFDGRGMQAEAGTRALKKRQAANIYIDSSSGGIVDLSVRNNIFLQPVSDKYSATLVNKSSGEWIGNYADGAGSDIYNFNSGTYSVIGNIARNGRDGGIAFNNGATGTISGNQIYRCDLGVGAGPEGSEANGYHSMMVIGNKIEACGDGINLGWFGDAGQIAPRNFTLSSNNILRCKRTAIRYDGHGQVVKGSLHLDDGYGTIVGNTIQGTGADSYDGNSETKGMQVFLGGCKNVAITGNVITDSGKTGVKLQTVQNCSFVGNVITGNQSGGVEVAGKSSVDIGSNVCNGNGDNDWIGVRKPL